MEKERLSAVTYAVRLGVVLKYLGQLVLLQAVLALVPLVASIVFREFDYTVRYAVVIAVMTALGLPLARRPGPSHVLVNEALVIAALAFVISPIIMAATFVHAGMGFGDALFEAVSAITTTGLSTLASVQQRAQTFLFARAWMQWYGGLGFVILSVSMLAGSTLVARRLVEPEITNENLVTTTRTHARRVLSVYLALTAAGLAALAATGTGWLKSLEYVMSAVSTGGFAPRDASLGGLGSPWATAVVSLLSFCGAVSLPLYYRAWYGGVRQIFADLELRALLSACLLVSALLLVFLVVFQGMSWPEALRYAPVMGVSAQTTTGFFNFPPVKFDAASKLVIVIAMIVGGSIGSTAGGIKLLRVLLVSRLLRTSLRRSGATQHAVIETWLGGRRIADEDALRAALLVMLFGATVVFSWLPFLLYGYAPLDALFDVVSATATVGLSTGVSGPGLPGVLKGVLCMDMLAGRLEILALLVVLYPRTWFGKRDESL